MKHLVPTACTLSCDKCHASFFFNGHGIFSSVEDARARASVLGWLHVNGRDYCPRCKDVAPRENSSDNKNSLRK